MGLSTPGIAEIIITDTTISYRISDAARITCSVRWMCTALHESGTSTNVQWKPQPRTTHESIHASAFVRSMPRAKPRFHDASDRARRDVTAVRWGRLAAIIIVVIITIELKMIMMIMIIMIIITIMILIMISNYTCM